MKEELQVFNEKMEKTIKVLFSELDGIRAGRASGAILDKLRVDYYGTPTPVNALATISVPEAKTLLVQPWDKTTLKLIEKAIQTSDIGINPQNDGTCLRLVFPPLTEERRKELVKQISKKGEESKVAIRAIRRDANETFKKAQKASTITEDDVKILEKSTQELHDKFIKQIDSITATKEKDILSV